LLTLGAPGRSCTKQATTGGNYDIGGQLPYQTQPALVCRQLLLRQQPPKLIRRLGGFSIPYMFRALNPQAASQPDLNSSTIKKISAFLNFHRKFSNFRK